MNKENILVLGAGRVVKPSIDYFLDKCHYRVTVATRTVAKAREIINGRPNARALRWEAGDWPSLHRMVNNSDFVVNFIPPEYQVDVAKICIDNRTHMIGTDFEKPEVKEMDQKAKDAGIMILNEIGEDPGLDHMSIKKILDELKKESKKVLSIASYGSGIPAFSDNRNPFGYKFSWNPKGLMSAVQSSAAYVKNGEKIIIPGKDLLKSFELIDIEDLGTFEVYPNRDASKYKEHYELDNDVSIFRGLLRYTGWCNTMAKLMRLNLLDNETVNDYENMTYAQFVKRLLSSSKDCTRAVADYFNIEVNDDFINKLKWLGLFDHKQIPFTKGTNVDVLVDLMLKKLSYKPHEKDMTIMHNEIIVGGNGTKEKRISTMVLEGIPGGLSAMSRAVSLPVAIIVRRVLEGKIKARGVQLPTIPEIYNPVLEELETFGIKFSHKIQNYN